MRPVLARALGGALAGSLATVPMTAVMVGLHRRLPPSQQYPLPPREITQDVLSRLGPVEKLSNRQLRYLSLAAHFGYGAATGALYGAARGRSGAAAGTAYGLGIWAVSYLGWIPAARILRPATAHPKRRRRLMLLAHVVWGSVTALCSKPLSRYIK